MKNLPPTKPHKSYTDLVAILESRGLDIPDKQRAERKLSQIGYYRLSGFWYPCREIKTDRNGKYLKNSKTRKLIRGDRFQQGSNFNDIIKLYLFDKKLRQLMLDAIERIEIHVRAVIAHELGYHNPLAYKEQSFINPKFCNDWKSKGVMRNHWKEWQKRHNNQIKRSQEDCIYWHRSNCRDIPIWVTIEAWDFGIMSKYYELLKGKYQNFICSRLKVSNAKTLREWLRTINTLRNRCAHHTRIWNQSIGNPIRITTDPYFQSLTLDQNAQKRIYGLICVLWFLVKNVGPSSGWIGQVADTIDSKPPIDSCQIQL
jgi:abortive infection bacteriophage resistance protein